MFVAYVRCEAFRKENNVNGYITPIYRFKRFDDANKKAMQAIKNAPAPTPDELRTQLQAIAEAVLTLSVHVEALERVMPN